MPTAVATYPSPELARFGRELDAIRREAALVDELSAAQLAWSPAPGRWSAGEHVAHMRVLTSLYLDAIDRGVAAARSRGHTGFDAYRPGLLGGFMTRLMEPPVRRRLPTAPIFVAPAEPGRDERPAWHATHDELDRRLHEAGGISLNQARVASPATRLLRLRLGDAFALLLAHERRHLWHIRQLRADPGFPPA
jgi:hypothetical protein